MSTAKFKSLKLQTNFTQIPNETLRNKKLSLRARGLLGHMLSYPADWVWNKTYLINELNEGRDAINAAFKELEQAGYIFKEQTRGKAGEFVNYTYMVSPLPLSEIQITENPSTGEEKPVNGKPVNGESATTNTFTTNTVFTNIISPNGEMPAQDLFGNHVNDQKKSKPEKAPPEYLSDGRPLHAAVIAHYKLFFEQITKVPAQITGGSGKGAKTIIAYFRRVVVNDQKFIGERSWENDMVFRFITFFLDVDRWQRIDGYYRDRLKLEQIAGDLPNILNQLKNGSSKAGKQTGGNVSQSAIADEIAARFSSPRQ